ncbi:type II secretion system minor pseudopilin GspK [Propionivibrio limicola]|uniref:type II secretion system minor pseudopilin GspK n=1 Tax=Propionivibrio limicola TaxID=167645 RepID=UPI00129290D5|nr:type II secretion system minor pseudopilin GspK [Propionivibrio limicola]
MRIEPSFPQRQKGIAVITAILVAALVASLAFALSARERQWLNLVSNRNDLAAAGSSARSAIDLARLTLRDDMRNNQSDHLLEAWTVPVPPINVEEGKVGGRLIELQGRFNLYNLQSGGKVSEEGLVALQRLLTTRNLSTGWAEKLAEAMASQVALWQKTQKADATAARLTSKILLVANLSELAELAGLDPEKMAALEPLVTSLPDATSVNANFAPPEVLMAVTPGLSIREAERLVSRRVATPFKSGQDFVNALPESIRHTTKPANYTVESQYFIAESEAWFGRAHLQLQALLYRQRGKVPDILWIRRV